MKLTQADKLYDNDSNTHDKLSNIQISIFVLMSILMVVAFYDSLKNNSLLYVLKYIGLALFLFVVVKETYKKIDLRKVIVFFCFSFSISFFNSFYLIINMNISSWMLSTGFTVMFCLVGIFSVFYFSKIPFNKFKRILFTFLITVFITVNLINIILIRNPAFYYFQDGRVRFLGVFENVNEMSRFALLGFLLVLRLWSLYKKPVIKFFFLITLFSSILLIYLSGSRTSLIICLLSILFIILGNIYLKTPNLLFYTLLILGLGALIIFGNYFIQSINSLSTIDFSELSSGRTDIWQRVFDVNVIELLFGTGSIQEVGIHNGYIEVIKYYGLIGFILWMVVLSFLVVRKIKFTLKNKTTTNIIGLGIVFSLLSYHMFEGALFSFGNLVSIYLWLEMAQLNDQQRGEG